MFLSMYIQRLHDSFINLECRHSLCSHGCNHIYVNTGNTVSLKHISFIWLFKHTIDGSYERGNVLSVSHSLLVTVTRAWGLRSIP